MLRQSDCACLLSIYKMWTYLPKRESTHIACTELSLKTVYPKCVIRESSWKHAHRRVQGTTSSRDTNKLNLVVMFIYIYIYFFITTRAYRRNSIIIMIYCFENWKQKRNNEYVICKCGVLIVICSFYRDSALILYVLK